MRVVFAAFALLAVPCFAAAETIYREDIRSTEAAELVRSDCAARNADAGAIAASLTGRGWRLLSDDETRQRDRDGLAAGFMMHWTTSQAWAPNDASSLMLVVGEGPVGQGQARASFCLIAEAASFARQRGAVRRWLGFSRAEAWGPGGDVFGYMRDDEGDLRNVVGASDAEQRAAMRAGRLGFVQVIGNQAASVINFSVIHAHEPPPP